MRSVHHADFIANVAGSLLPVTDRLLLDVSKVTAGVAVQDADEAEM